MAMIADIARPATAATRTTRKPLALRLLDWLADRNARYAEAQHVARMTEDRLRDAGLSHKDLSRAFYGTRGQRADNGATPIVVSPLGMH